MSGNTKSDQPETIDLSPEAWKQFEEILDNPKPPTDALKKLMQDDD